MTPRSTDEALSRLRDEGRLRAASTGPEQPATPWPPTDGDEVAA